MSWATQHIENLKNGQTVSFRPTGHSMTGKVNSGQLCTVEPVDSNEGFKEGDIVLCKVNGNQYLHLIKAIESDIYGEEYQIGNNRGGVNGWIASNLIFGKLIKVED